jgi:hypothetical protein
LLQPLNCPLDGLLHVIHAVSLSLRNFDPVNQQRETTSGFVEHALNPSPGDDMHSIQFCSLLTSSFGRAANGAPSLS